MEGFHFHVRERCRVRCGNGTVSRIESSLSLVGLELYGLALGTDWALD